MKNSTSPPDTVTNANADSNKKNKKNNNNNTATTLVTLEELYSEAGLTYQPDQATNNNNNDNDANTDSNEIVMLNQQRYECPSCMEEYPFEDVTALSLCKHYYCNTCYHQYLRIQISEGNLLSSIKSNLALN